jgi:hypothetical protein
MDPPTEKGNRTCPAKGQWQESLLDTSRNRHSLNQVSIRTTLRAASSRATYTVRCDI